MISLPSLSDELTAASELDLVTEDIESDPLVNFVYNSTAEALRFGKLCALYTVVNSLPSTLTDGHSRSLGGVYETRVLKSNNRYILVLSAIHALF